MNGRKKSYSSGFCSEDNFKFIIKFSSGAPHTPIKYNIKFSVYMFLYYYAVHVTSR